MLIKRYFATAYKMIKFLCEVLVPAHNMTDDIPNRPFPLLYRFAKNILGVVC